MAGLQGTPITREDFEKIVQGAFSKLPDLKLKNVDAKVIGQGKGFASTVLKLSAEWEGGVESVPGSFVLKVPNQASIEQLIGSLSTTDEAAKDAPPPDADASGMAVLMKLIHAKECWTLELFGRVPPEGVPVPKLYASRLIGDVGGPGFALLEDLSDDVSQLESYSVGQLEQLMDAYAAWTAYTLLHKAELGAVEDFPRELMEGFMAVAGLSFDGLVKIKPDYFEGTKDRMVKSDMMGWLLELREKCSKELGQPASLIHGDFHGNNILFSEDGAKLRSILDWQAIRPGLAVEDLGRLLVSAASTETRRAQTKALLGRYHARLTQLAPAHDVGTLDQLLQAFRTMFPNAASGIVTVMPGILASPLVTGLPEEEAAKATQTILDFCRDLVQDSAPDSHWI